MLETGKTRERRADPHAAGTVEHLLGIAGVLRCGPVDEPVELEPGDLLSFAADVPHVYAGLRDDTRTLLLMDYAQ